MKRPEQEKRVEKNHPQKRNAADCINLPVTLGLATLHLFTVSALEIIRFVRDYVYFSTLPIYMQ